jgi:SSS family solute:Na+ symporter
MSERYFWSYTRIPLSSIMFPHMALRCCAARTATAFRRTVVLYPVAIMAIWLPCVFLGVVGTQLAPGLINPDGILLHVLNAHAPVWLAGILGAGIMSAVMASDNQVLAMSTMFTKDVFTHYGGNVKYGERGSVFFARAFILGLTAVAYVVALITPVSIFDLAVRFAFSGFAAMAP